MVCIGVAWVIGRIALGLRADYLAIATLGISEIVVAVAKNEEWMTRGVKNITSLKRAPVPRETNLQQAEWFQNLVSGVTGLDPTDADFKLRVIEFSSIFVKLCFTFLFAAVLAIVLFLAIRALNSPWGRMMRAIRDNDVAASAMGKNVVKRHREVFIVGAAILGVSGAMLTTLDGQFTPTGYQPLRYTFLIWVMVIVGGSGNNLGAVLGGFVIWFFCRWYDDGTVNSQNGYPYGKLWYEFPSEEGVPVARVRAAAEAALPQRCAAAEAAQWSLLPAFCRGPEDAAEAIQTLEPALGSGSSKFRTFGSSLQGKNNNSSRLCLHIYQPFIQMTRI